MNAVTTWTFENAGVRSITDAQGDPWFVGKDVCRCLAIGNHRDALSRLEGDERKGVAIADSLGKNPQKTTIINEPGVYRLIMTSRVPAAERFKRWLFHDVLPTLRRRGHYSLPAGVRPYTVDPGDARAYAALIHQVRAIYGAVGADRLYRALPLPQVAFESPAAMAERRRGRIGEFGISADEVGRALDGYACLRHLLGGAISRAGGRIGDLLPVALERPGVRDALGEAGVLVNPEGYPGYVAVAVRHPRLDRIFAVTEWAPDWRLPLLSLDGALQAEKAVRFPDRKRLAVLLPLMAVELVADG